MTVDNRFVRFLEIIEKNKLNENLTVRKMFFSKQKI